MDFQNKVALVTGAASGIGLDIVKELLKNNIQGVVMTDINIETGQTAWKNLCAEYEVEKILFLKVDVCNQEEYENAFKTAISKFGHLDIVVNNAGIASDILYEKLIDINMTGVVRGTLLGLKYMGKNEKGNGGVILSTSSITAIEDQHAIPIYAGTKAGVMNIMRGFGHPLYYDKYGIRTMAILPGFTETNIDETLKPIGDFETCSNVIWSRSKQTSIAVAGGAVHAIKYGESGSIWIIDDSKLYLYNPLPKGSYGQLINNNL